MICEMRKLYFSLLNDDVCVHISFSAFLANVLRYVRYMLSAVRLLSVCDVGAPYSGG